MLYAYNSFDFSIDLNNNTETNLALTLDCLRSQTVTAVVAEFVWNKPGSPLIYGTVF